MGDKKVDPEWIAKHGKQIDEYVTSMIDAARSAINADGVYNLEGGDFSITLSAAAAAYPIAAQFGFENSKTLRDGMEKVAGNLAATANRYAEAEKANTEH